MTERVEKVRSILKGNDLMAPILQDMDNNNVTLSDIFSTTVPTSVLNNDVGSAAEGALMPTDSTMNFRSTAFRRLSLSSFKEPNNDSIHMTVLEQEKWGLNFKEIIVPRIEERVEESLLFSKKMDHLVRAICSDEATYREFYSQCSNSKVAENFLLSAFGKIDTRQLVGEMNYTLASVFQKMAVKMPDSSPLVLSSLVAICSTVISASETRADSSEFYKFDYNEAVKMDSSDVLFAQIRSRQLNSNLNDEVLKAKKLVDDAFSKGLGVSGGASGNAKGFKPSFLLDYLNNCLNEIKKRMTSLFDDERVLKAALHYSVDLAVPEKKNKIEDSMAEIKNSTEFEKIMSNITIFGIAVKEYDPEAIYSFTAGHILKQMDRINSILNDMDTFQTISLDQFASGFGVYASKPDHSSAMETLIICDYYVNEAQAQMFEMESTTFTDSIKDFTRRDAYRDALIGQDYASAQPAALIDSTAMKMISLSMRQEERKDVWRGNLGWVNMDLADLFVLACRYSSRVILRETRDENDDEKLEFAFYVNDMHKRVYPIDTTTFESTQWTQNVLRAFIASYPPEMEITESKNGSFGQKYSYYKSFGIMPKSKAFLGIIPENTFSKPDSFDVSFYDAKLNVTASYDALAYVTNDDKKLRDFRFTHSTAAHALARSMYQEIALIYNYRNAGLRKEDAEDFYMTWSLTVGGIVKDAFSSSPVLSQMVAAVKSHISAEAKAERRKARKTDSDSYVGPVSTGLSADPVRMGGITITCFCTHLQFMSGMDMTVLRDLMLADDNVISTVGIHVSNVIRNK